MKAQSCKKRGQHLEESLAQVKSMRAQPAQTVVPPRKNLSSDPIEIAKLGNVCVLYS